MPTKYSPGHHANCLRDKEERKEKNPITGNREDDRKVELPIHAEYMGICGCKCLDFVPVESRPLKLRVYACSDGRYTRTFAHPNMSIRH